jgi:hypothetical protein
MLRKEALPGLKTKMKKMRNAASLSSRYLALYLKMFRKQNVRDASH